MIISEEDYIQHHGVKGQKWGIRHDPKTTGVSSKPAPKKKKRLSDKQKKILTGVGIGGAIAVASVLAAIGAKKYGVIPTQPHEINVDWQKMMDAKARDVMPTEPTGVIHATRGLDKGFHFAKKGGLEEPLREYDKSGVSEHKIEAFTRYGDRDEKIFARFLDPEGRKDRSGRVIPHDVIVPEHLAKDIETPEDLIEKIWPLLKDDYEKTYHRKPT